MVFAVLDYLQLLNLDWGSDLNNEQFLDDLILEHIWNQIHPLKNLFTSQITTMDPSLHRSWFSKIFFKKSIKVYNLHSLQGLRFNITG